MHYFTPAKTLPEGTIYLTDLTHVADFSDWLAEFETLLLRHRLHPHAAAGERRTAHCRPQNLHRMDKGTPAATVRTLRRHVPYRTRRGATGILPRTIFQTRPCIGRELHRRSRCNNRPASRRRSVEGRLKRY